MKIARSKAELSGITGGWKERGLRIGFVPSMGALHGGHVSLVKIAVAHADMTVASIYVNPAQFAPGEDFASYPRDEKSDCAMLENAGANLAYIPSEKDIYPDGPVSDIRAGAAAKGLESDFRPHFFDGVCSVVFRLFQQVRPDIAVFGEKDYQQLCVIREMVRERDLPVEIVGAPVIRDEEGLALSSRNAYLSAKELKIARRLNKILFDIVKKPSPLIPFPEGRGKLLAAGFDEVQYLEPRWGRLLAAVRIGKTRLIDNVEI